MKRVLDIHDGGVDIFHGHSDGSFTIETVADVEGNIERNKSFQDSWKGQDMHFIGSIPNVILHGWLIEDGISFRQFMQDKDVLKRIIRTKLMDPAWRDLKIAPGTY